MVVLSGTVTVWIVSLCFALLLDVGENVSQNDKQNWRTTAHITFLIMTTTTATIIIIIIAIMHKAQMHSPHSNFKYSKFVPDENCWINKFNWTLVYHQINALIFMLSFIWIIFKLLHANHGWKHCFDRFFNGPLFNLPPIFGWAEDWDEW